MKNEDDKYFHEMIMDTDFQDRSVLKIIVIQEFEPLLTEDDPQAANLMETVYLGDGYQNCDGTLEGYSTFSHIINTESEARRPGVTRNDPILEMVTKGF